MKTRPIYLSEQQRLSELQAFVKLCFMCLEEYDYKEVCNLSGLSLATIYRLDRGEFGLCCRFGTIQAIGLAAGLRFSLEDNRVSVVKRSRK